MKLKLKILIAIACLLGAPLLHADGDKGKHHRHHAERTAKMMQELQLSEEQQESVQQILREQREKGRALRKSRHEEMKALKAETREKLAAVLDEEQLQRYDQLLAEKRKKMRKRFGRHKETE